MASSSLFLLAASLGLHGCQAGEPLQLQQLPRQQPAPLAPLPRLLQHIRLRGRRSGARERGEEGGEEGKKKKQRAKVREKGEGAGKWEKEGKKKEILKQQAKLGEEGDRAEKRRKERGDEEGDEGQRSGVEERVKGKCAEEVHSEEGRSEEASPERSWRTVFSSASPADSSPKPSLGLLTDPDPVPNQGSRFGAGPVPDQSGRPGGWCGLCGDGSGWVQCGACDGKGAYATAPGAQRSGWSGKSMRRDTLLRCRWGERSEKRGGRVTRAEEWLEWLEWQEHAMRRAVKVQKEKEEDLKLRRSNICCAQRKACYGWEVIFGGWTRWSRWTSASRQEWRRKELLQVCSM
ncbi:hypothetical protein CLOP_g5548 [Closterium sp. NIES-67]|nr:hypothetical protein CLOP_g5548 [Closterium sp. NIES-67]